VKKNPKKAYADAKKKVMNSSKEKLGKTYKGKSTKPGGGGRFQKMVDDLMKRGKSRKQAEAIAASAGRKKYGAAEFNKMAASGQSRKA
jgi:hypothetical protein